jgi:hypothetical protein
MFGLARHRTLPWPGHEYGRLPRSFGEEEGGLLGGGLLGRFCIGGSNELTARRSAGIVNPDTIAFAYPVFSGDDLAPSQGDIQGCQDNRSVDYGLWQEPHQTELLGFKRRDPSTEALVSEKCIGSSCSPILV